MSVDKLVDSTQLDADLTSVADAIRAKGGTSASLAFPAEFVSAIAAIPTGGGGVTAATGTITLASDFSLTTSAQNIPGLQLSFQPDFFYIIMDRDSFEDISTPSGGLWEVFAAKRTWFPPVAQSGSATPETVTSAYTWMIATSVTANSSIPTGYGIGTMGFLGTSYYSRYSVNADGTISVGRYSTASSKMYAGTYRYFAVKI